MHMLTRLVRVFRHRWQSDRDAESAVPPALLAQLTAQVATSEAGHSGEIRIYVEVGLPLQYLWQSASTAELTHQRALALFGELRVWDTARNNGVLIYLLLAERRIEIVADRGLNERVPPGTWPDMVETMRAAFTAGDFAGGLSRAVHEVSVLLLRHFEAAEGVPNPNELPNEPILG